MHIPGTKMPYEFSLNYRNQLSYDGPVGNKFDHNYNIFLAENTGSVMFYNGKLGMFSFTQSGSSYVSDPGTKATLSKNAGSGLYSIVFDDGTKYDFGSNLKISKIADRSGNSSTFSYNSNKQLTAVTDGLGRGIAYAYGTDSRLQSVTEPGGRSATLAYYGSSETGGTLHDLKSVTIASGSGSKTVSFTYTGSHNIATLTDAKGQVYVSNAYNADNRVTSQAYGSGTVSYAYTLSGSRVATNTVTNANGVQTKYTYDSNGNTTKREIYDSAGGGKTEYNYGYDSNARLVKTVLPRGNGTTYAYDSR